MRCTLALALVLLLSLAVPAQAAADPFAKVVGRDDPALGQALINLDAPVAYLDANGNQRPDAAQPAEPVYLDLDASGAVSYGDLRLTAFDVYPAGSMVDVTNRDVGLRLTTASGWLAGSGGTWYADLDGTQTVTANDIRLDDGQRVAATDGAIGEALVRSPANAGAHALSILDLNGNGRHDVGEPLYVELDASYAAGSGRVSPGDVQLLPRGLAVDGAPTRAELDAALAAAGVKGNGSAYGSPTGTPGTKATLAVALAGAALALSVYAVVSSRQQARPKNPFK